MAKKLKLQVGDQVTLEDTYYDREFAFLVTEIVDYDATLGIFMKQDVLNSLLGAPEDDFNCLLSNEKLDVPEEYVAKYLTRSDILGATAQLMDMFDTVLKVFNISSVVIYMILMYILTKTVIEKNALYISYMKVFGYDNREVGKLYLVLTKGLPRWKVIVSKSLVQILCWSICYWMVFGVTQLYTFWFWREDEVKHWLLAGSCIYFMGIWLILLMVLISTWLESNLNVLLGVGGVTLLCYLAGMWKKTASWMPTRLLQAGKLLEGALKPKDFFGAIGMALAFGVLFMMLAIAVFNKKKI